jgi:starch phosphorylase
MFNENILTIVWARRFANYKRANLILQDFERFLKLINHKKYPVQLIWAGKPYPEDYHAIHIFNDIYWKTKALPGCAVLTGYELALSAFLKRGSDVWLNNPRLYHEASGTSGMTAAMNGSINLSIPDGWVPEFARHLENCFVIQPADVSQNEGDRDKIEIQNLFTVLEKEVIPMYYHHPKKWVKIIQQAVKDALPEFGSNRMAQEYYEKLYNK